MRIVKVEPNKPAYTTDIPNTLDAIQAAVGGGFFEVVYCGNHICLCCNDEGKLNGMPPNRRVGYDIICGEFFLVGDDGCGDFRSLTDTECEDLCEIFAEPHTFTGNEPELTPRYDVYTF